MKTPLQYLLPLLLLSLLASCYGDNTWELVPEDKSIPPRTDTGADILVCMVNNDLDVQVYREVPGFLSNVKEVNIYTRLFYTDTGKAPGYVIRAQLIPEDRPRTYINIPINVEKPEINTTYKIFPYDYQYEIDDLVWRNQFYLDTNASMVRFSRFDTLVAAGEFAFKAVNKYKDTVLIRGYFDIPFSK